MRCLCVNGSCGVCVTVRNLDDELQCESMLAILAKHCNIDPFAACDSCEDQLRITTCAVLVKICRADQCNCSELHMAICAVLLICTQCFSFHSRHLCEVDICDIHQSEEFFSFTTLCVCDNNITSVASIATTRAVLVKRSCGAILVKTNCGTQHSCAFL